MKKNIFIFSILLSATISLSGCSIIDAIINGGSDSAISTNNDKNTIQYTYSDMAKYNVYNCDYCPTVGNPKLLVIPIWFTDSSQYINTHKKESVRLDIEKAYIGTSSDTGWYSVAEFYKTESKGKCNLSATVTDWYECGNLSSYFYSDVKTTQELANTAADWYFNNHPNDSRKNYDSDSNGYLDGVMLIYGSPNYVTMNKEQAKNMWAYAYWTYDSQYKNMNNPGAYVYFWASYDFMYSSGKRAMAKTGYSYGYGDNSFCTIDTHTYIHEMGHVFGLDDYYDYSKETYIPAGGFSMQDYNVGSHDPYSIMAFGWSNPIVPTSSCTLEINRFQDNGDFILLSPEFNGSPFDEYMLLELYSPTGLNEFDCNHSYGGHFKGPLKTGIRLWHVDARLSYYVNRGGEWVVDDKKITTVPQDYCFTAFSNTYEGGNHESSFGKINKKYYNYNLLQLIRKNVSETYLSKNIISDDDLFYAGDSFSIDSYKSQFVEGNKLNSGKNLGWNFKIDSISNGIATITLTRI